MPELLAVDRPELPRYRLSLRLRQQLVYFLTPPGTPGVPRLRENEYFFARADVERWLEDGVIELVSPLDTANTTEVELSEEQEALLEWLRDSRVEHARLIE